MFESLGITDIRVFTLGVVLIILAPGPNSLYVLVTGMRHGVQAGFKAAGGVFVGDSILMLAASLGVDSLMRLYPFTFTAIQYAGGAYLAFLGLKMLLALRKPGPEHNGNANAHCKESPFTRSLALSLSNPKAILFFISFFVQFVDPAYGHPGAAFLVLASIVQCVSLFYLSCLIFGGSKLAAVFRGRTGLVRACNALIGMAFIGFGCRLVARASS